MSAPHPTSESGPEPKVSVVVPTFQHVDTIEQAVASVLAQEVDFPYEILLGEDGSTDGTLEVCERLAEQHPDRIRLFRHGELPKIRIDGRQTGRRNWTELLRKARGTYIAHLDGDDWWTDPTKLARQVALLDARPELSFCFHDHARVRDGEDLGTTHATDALTFTTPDLIWSYPCQTLTLMFRRSAVPDPFPDWLMHEAPLGDKPLVVLVSLTGPGERIPRDMATYRVGVGLWGALAEEKRMRLSARTSELLGHHLPAPWNAVAQRHQAVVQLHLVRQLALDGRRDEALAMWRQTERSHLTAADRRVRLAARLALWWPRGERGRVLKSRLRALSGLPSAAVSAARGRRAGTG
ncbi:MAG: glycosyltransferase family 2 protein [Alphaproteobacteria bacterium]|nr:glycosyltransferase family 2 protein [Alphaproteobacteria bacterium]MCB9695767.1 glycosyltransferase family 2 protein [Alphaproteobacteria bacterium]